jgi:transcription antitermination factor NusG
MNQNNENKSIDEKYWHALYVRSRAEKKVFDQLQDKGIESYLPMLTRIKQWSDRKKKVEEPLFRSYVFVRNNERQHYDVLGVYGVVRFVTFEHKPVIVPDKQIIAIKKYLDNPVEDEDDLKNIDLKEGQLVRITNGSMQGLTGRLVSVKSKRRLLVNIDVVGQSIPVSIPRTKVEPIQEKQEVSISYDNN